MIAPGRARFVCLGFCLVFFSPGARSQSGRIAPVLMQPTEATPLVIGQPAALLLTPASPMVHYAGRSLYTVPWSGDRTLLLLGVALADPVGSSFVQLATTGQRFPLNIRKQVYPKTRVSVPAHFVELSPCDRQKIAADRQLLSSLWSRQSQQKYWAGNFIAPLKGRVTGRFGLRRLLNGRHKSRHLGVDLQAPLGAAVVVANNGVVVLAQPLFVSGHTVVVDHGRGLYSLYFHLQHYQCSKGDLLKKGAPVGRVGQTGRASGPHLHFAIKLGQVFVDPETLLRLDLSQDPDLVGAARPANTGHPIHRR